MLSSDRILVFGNGVLPALLLLDRKLGSAVVEIHGWTALLLPALIGVHLDAAHNVARWLVGDATLAALTRMEARHPLVARPPWTDRLPRWGLGAFVPFGGGFARAA